MSTGTAANLAPFQDSGLRTQDHDRRPQVRVIPILDDEVEAAQESLHVGALHASSTAVDEADLPEAA